MEILYRMTVKMSSNILLKYNKVTKAPIAVRLGDRKDLLVLIATFAFMDDK